VLHAADVFLENGVFIEFTPSKHAIQQTFAMYVYEPGGTRIEICTAVIPLLPDWEPITWTEANARRDKHGEIKLLKHFILMGHRMSNHPNTDLVIINVSIL